MLPEGSHNEGLFQAQHGKQGGGKSAQKRKRKLQASQEELDARHPGNARNGAAIQHISAAFGWYKEWLSKQQHEPRHVQGDPPLAARPVFGGTLFPPHKQPPSPKDNSQSYHDQQDQQQQQQQQKAWRVQVLPYHSSQAPGIRTVAPVAASAAQEVDWVVLGRLRQVLKPKVALLSPEEVNALSTPEHGPSEQINAHSTPEHGPAEQVNAHSTSEHGSSEQQLLLQGGLQPGEGIKTLPDQRQAGGEQHFHKACTQQDQDHHHHHHHQQQQQQQQQCRPQQPQNLYNSLVGNPSTYSAIALAHESLVWLPPRSRFIMGDLMDTRTLGPLLPQPGCTGTYKCIVLDPPWENASAKRSGRYQTLPSRNLLKLPIPRLLHPEGVMCLWITNREKLWRFVQNELLPAWRLEHAATWWWLKLDASSTQPVLPLHSMHRHPFEAVLVLTPTDASQQAQQHGTAAQQACAPPARDLADGAVFASVQMAPGQHGTAAQQTCAPPARDLVDGAVFTSVQMAPGQHGAAAQQTCAPPARDLADGAVLVSVPAAEHSHKPHLGPLLERVLPAQSRSGKEGGAEGLQHGQGSAANQRLELFARELHEGWDAVGDEVLRFQQLASPNAARACQPLTVVEPAGRLCTMSTEYCDVST